MSHGEVTDAAPVAVNMFVHGRYGSDENWAVCSFETLSVNPIFHAAPGFAARQGSVVSSCESVITGAWVSLSMKKASVSVAETLPAVSAARSEMKFVQLP